MQDNLLDKRKEGTLVEVGTNDILTQVLGTKEHPGRVRAQSRGVTQRDYFLKPAGDFSGLQQYQFQFKQHQSQQYLDDFQRLEQSFEQRLHSQAEQFEEERKREREEREREWEQEREEREREREEREREREREREEREREREMFLTKFTELANRISSKQGIELSLPTIVSPRSEIPTLMEVVNESLVSSNVFSSSHIHIVIDENIYYIINIILSSSWACRIIRSLDYWLKMAILLLLDK